MKNIFFSLVLFSVIQVSVSVKCGPRDVCYCYTREKENVEHVMMDCSNTMLHLIEICSSMASEHVTNITTLDASYNAMETLNRSSFKGCENVPELLLSSNILKFVQDDTFTELPKLTKLDLENNTLATVYHNMTLNFGNSTMLNTLILNRNYKPVQNITLSYPRLINVMSLKTLAMDGLHDTAFGEDYRSLGSLTSLTLSGNNGICNVGLLKNDTFKNTMVLETLDVSNCNLTNIDAGTFMPLSKLKWLDLSVNRQLGFRVLRNVSYGLQFTEIDFLNYSKVHNTFGVGKELRKVDVCYLRNTTLRSIALNSNKLQLFETNLPILLPKTLQEVHVEDNKLSFGPYLLQTGCMANGTHLFANNQNIMHNLKMYKQDVHDVADRVYPLKDDCPYMKKDYMKNVSQGIINCMYFDSDDDIGVITAGIPSNLKALFFSGCNLHYKLIKMLVTPLKNYIEELDFSNNVLYSWVGPLGPLFHIKTLNLSRNYCSYIGDKFFLYMYSLETLDISKNFIGIHLTDDHAGTIFDKLTNLKTLNMSSNQIKKLPSDVFNNLLNLEVLDLSVNIINEFIVSFDNLRNLTHLDLNNNALQTLPVELIHHFEDLYSNRGINFSINLDKNVLRCSCINKNFLEWIVKRHAFFVNFDRYIFTDESGKPISQPIFLKRVADLDKSCRSYTIVIVVCTLSLSVFLSVVIGGVVYKNRWKLRYFIYIKKRRYQGYQRVEEEAANEYKYDAFISYADDDGWFIKREIDHRLGTGDAGRGLSLCIHDRDFRAGHAVVDNILDAIHDSRKTVAVLSPSFLNSKWCMYEFNMARMESIYSRDGRGCLVVVMLEKVPANIMPLEMVHCIRQNSYIEFTQDGEGNELFWNNLEEAINDITALEQP